MEKQRVLIGAGFVIVMFSVLTFTPIPASLLAFLVLGIIPGTDLAVPAWAILLVYPALIVVALYWVYGEAFFIGETPKPLQPVSKQTTKRKRRSKSTLATKRTKSAKRQLRASA